MVITSILSVLFIASLVVLIVFFVMLVIRIITKKGKEKILFILTAALIFCGLVIFGFLTTIPPQEPDRLETVGTPDRRWTYQTDFLFAYEVDKTGDVEWLYVDEASLLYSALEYTFDNRIPARESFMFSLLNIMNTPTKDGQRMRINEYFQRVYEGSYVVSYIQYDDIRVNDEISIEYKDEREEKTSNKGTILIDKEKGIMKYTRSNDADIEKFIILYNAYRFADTNILIMSREETWNLLFDDLQRQFQYDKHKSAMVANIMLHNMIRNSL